MGVRSDESVAVGPYLLPGMALLPLGIALSVAGGIFFPPLRFDGWLIGSGAGTACAVVVLVVSFLVGGTPARRFARRVMGILAGPGLIASTLGVTLLANGLLDASAPVTHRAVAINVRQTNVDGEGTNEENVLVDVDDWGRPGSRLTLRFEHGEIAPDVKTIALRTRRGALGVEWRVRR